MKLVIDDKVCLKHHLTLEEFLIALAAKKDIGKVIDNMVARGIIEDGTLTQQWSDEIDDILLNSSGGIDDEERLSSLANKMKECFPKGKMPGTTYYYRCNAREIILKLKKFFEVYGNYPDERIIDATKRYIASFQGNYRYLPLIKYFIYKEKLKMGEDGMQHVFPESPLATYLENKEDNNLVTASDDWLMTVRN